MKTELEIADIFHNDSSKAYALCRICLTENAEASVSLFKVCDRVSYSEKVMLCAKVQMYETDGLPDSICQACCMELDLADNFRTKCEYSDTILRKVYLNRTIKCDLDEKDNCVEKNEVIKPEMDAWFNVLEGEIKQELPDNVNGDIHDQFACVKKGKKQKSKKHRDLDSIIDADDTGDIDSQGNDFELSEVAFERLPKVSKSKKKKLICGICDAVFTRKYALKDHVKTAHKETKLFLGSVTGNGTERRFHCVECDYKTPYKKTLIYHIRTHTGEKPYVCDVCQRAFAQPSSLISHKKTHSDKMYFTCPECGRQFKYKQKYDRHKMVHVNEKKFVCSICDKPLKSKITLDIHMNRHYNIKNYSCETCGSTFVTSSELINHSKMHTNQRNFCCNICDFRTYKKTSLDKHLKHHSGERPFKCEHCDLAYCTRGELKCHTRRHTKEKNYSCPVCHQKFIHSPSLNRHMLKLHGIKFKWSNVVDRRVVK